jgi:hypothetical protein
VEKGHSTTVRLSIDNSANADSKIVMERRYCHILRRKAIRISSSTYSKREPISIFTVLIAEHIAITVCYLRRENFTVVYRSVLIWALGCI